MNHRKPRIRQVNKATGSYPLNEFPRGFAEKLGKELLYRLACKDRPSIEGEEWEAIFAASIGAKWKPSNVGLDDVILDRNAWAAKTVKALRPSTQKTIRLISGRNSPVFSFGTNVSTKGDPNDIGQMVIEIWNKRVTDLQKLYDALRTVILIKSSDLTEVVVFEIETIAFDTTSFQWRWNEAKNLEGTSIDSKQHRFTWQPHGSQFTIIERVPNRRLVIELNKPPQLSRQSVLKAVGFTSDWIQARILLG